jgi:mRNA interferase RelE/StbE
MKFQIIWSEPAAKQLKKLNQSAAKRIFNKVSELENNPYRNVKKLVNFPYFRLRIGEYRVIINIEKSELQILILKVGNRKNIYK